MINGWLETFEQELTAYLLSRTSTTLTEFAGHFNLSGSSATYWLSCLLRSGRVRIVHIEGRTDSHADSAPTISVVTPERDKRCRPEAILAVCRESEAA